MHRLGLALFLSLFLTLSGEKAETIELFYLESNPAIPEETWEKLKPYFLPFNHPVRKKVDAIFKHKYRVIANGNTLKRAGFTNNIPEVRSHTIVTRHKSIQGFIFKLYTDDQPYHHKKPEWKLFKRRISGANVIRKYIDKNQLQKIFKVPMKWLYPVPYQPSSRYAPFPKHFILIEEDMDLLKSHDNYTRWRNPHVVTTGLLDQIYALVTTCVFHDGLRPDNLPFAKDGKIAFIDTQKVKRGPVRYKQLIPYLPSKRQSYWTALTSI